MKFLQLSLMSLFFAMLGAAEDPATNAARALRSAIFPAQVQFQAGAYIDPDGNGRGDYSSDLRELSGLIPAGSLLTVQLHLLDPNFQAAIPEVQGYAFQIHGFGENAWVGYAWPLKVEATSVAFAIDHSCTIWERPMKDASVPFAARELWHGLVNDELPKPAAPWVKSDPSRWANRMTEKIPKRMSAELQRQEEHANKRSHMRQLVLAANVYQNDNDGVYPPDMDMTLQAVFLGEIKDSLLKTQGEVQVPHPFLYIRPVPSGVSQQPHLVEDPACWRGQGTNVLFCDGHGVWLEREDAQVVWVEAQRLAGLPEARTTGTLPKAWAAVQARLDAACELAHSIERR